MLLGGMFEQHIENWKNRLQEIVTLGASPYHGGVAASFLSEGPFLPDSYRRYFAAEVGWRLYETRVELEENPRFRLAENPIAEDFFGKFDETLRQTATFTAVDVSAVIDAAIKTRLNFLCRPRTTLKWFVFRGEPTLLVREILLRLNYFDDYSYLTEAVINRIADHHQRQSSSDLLSVVEFERIVEEVDNDYILDLTPHQFVDILAPLFEFFSPDTPPNVEKAIPTEALIIFLDDKGVEPIAQELERAYYDNDCAEVTETIFLEIVTRILDAIEEDVPTEDTEDETEAQAEVIENTLESIGQEADIPSEIVSIPEESHDTLFPTANEVTDKTTFRPLKEDEFLAAPGAVAATIALKEFIRPEFTKREQPAKFAPKFAPALPPETVEAAANEQVISADKLLEAAEESLEDVQESLEAIEESLEHLEVIAEEVGETLEKAVESLEEIEEEISENNFGLENKDGNSEINVREAAEESTGEREPQLAETIREEHLPLPEEEAILEQIFEEMNASDDSEEQHEKTESTSDEQPNIEEQGTEQPEALEQVEISGKIDKDADIAAVAATHLAEDIGGDSSIGSDTISAPEEHANASDIPENADELIFADGNSDDVIALILEQSEGDSDVGLYGYGVTKKSEEIANTQDYEAVQNVPFEIVAQEEHSEHTSHAADQIAEAERIMAASYPSLSRIISDKQRDRFIKKLFGKEHARYDFLVHEIDNCPSWKDAAQRFDQFLIVHNIAHDNSAAEEFREAIKSRYSS